MSSIYYSNITFTEHDSILKPQSKSNNKIKKSNDTCVATSSDDSKSNTNSMELVSDNDNGNINNTNVDHDQYDPLMSDYIDSQDISIDLDVKTHNKHKDKSKFNSNSNSNCNSNAVSNSKTESTILTIGDKDKNEKENKQELVDDDITVINNPSKNKNCFIQIENVKNSAKNELKIVNGKMKFIFKNFKNNQLIVKLINDNCDKIYGILFKIHCPQYPELFWFKMKKNEANSDNDLFFIYNYSKSSIPATQSTRNKNGSQKIFIQINSLYKQDIRDKFKNNENDNSNDNDNENSNVNKQERNEKCCIVIDVIEIGFVMAESMRENKETFSSIGLELNYQRYLTAMWDAWSGVKQKQIQRYILQCQFDCT